MQELSTNLSIPVIGESAEQHANSLQMQQHRDQILAFFERVYEENVRMSPTRLAYLGRKERYDEWDDLSDSFALKRHEKLKTDLQELNSFADPALMDEKTALSVALFRYNSEQSLAAFAYRHYSYPVNSLFGWHTEIPNFLMNIHRIDNLKDANAFITRVETVPQLMQQLIHQLQLRQSRSVMLPRFIYPRVLESTRKVISGYPFERKAKHDNPLLENFKQKVATLDLYQESKTALVKRLEQGLKRDFQPAYEQLIQLLEQQQALAGEEAGVWRFDQGLDYYAEVLRQQTTTELSADQIHNLGLSEIERIHTEIRGIMAELGFAGTMEEFFRFTHETERFFYPNNAQGREAFLTDARFLLSEMELHLNKLFYEHEIDALEVKAIEAYRVASAPIAYYQRPSADGNRAGVFYANLARLPELPRFRLAPLVYHEGLPGHHLQISLANRNPDLPKFRRHSSYPAFAEGWALYAEALPEEVGLYEDPMQRYGMLLMELWRAMRLVLDTGIHAKGWGRDQAIRYRMANTPFSREDSEQAVDRYIVFPGQATTYKIGQLRILQLRQQSESQLGNAFDVREFHEQLLQRGSLPLAILEQQVRGWLEQAADP